MGATDTLLQDWTKLRGFANPSWSLNTVFYPKSAQMIIVVPLWKTQSWFPVLLELLEDYPRVLSHQVDLVVMPSDQGFLMQQGVPTLIVFSISGNPFHLSLTGIFSYISCLPHGNLKTTEPMAPVSLNGKISASI